jgi:glycosyltransferase involved in cell wall biosynthesis
MPYQYASLQGSESYRDKYFATLYSNICKSHIESLKSSKVKWVVPSPHMIKNLGLRDGRVASIPNPLPRVENLKMKKPEYYLFIGAGDVFDPRKGLQDLLVNWIECYDQEKPRKLKIVGPIWPHSQPTMLVEMSRNYGVEYFGHVSDFQIMQLLFSKSFAIFVPSLDETFGQVILEALANQTKVIARRDLSSLAAFQNYEDGIYELDFKLEALGTILDSIETEEILDKSFSSKVKIEFAATTIAGKLVNFYRI